MIDAHAHLDQYGKLLPRALSEIRESAIFTLAVSMDVASYRATREISDSEPLILPSFGIHPWEAPRFADDLSSLDSLIEASPLLGEIGLDHFFVDDPGYYPAQDDVFAYFLDAAEGKRKVINVHTKGAEAAVVEHLEGRCLPGSIVHWYSGPLELVDRFLALGAYFTIGVEVLRSEHIQSLATMIPVERLFTETDNPGGWEWMEGTPGFPGLLNRVEDSVARLRGVDREVLSGQVAENMEGLLAKVGLAMPGRA